MTAEKWIGRLACVDCGHFNLFDYFAYVSSAKLQTWNTKKSSTSLRAVHILTSVSIDSFSLNHEYSVVPFEQPFVYP